MLKEAEARGAEEQRRKAENAQGGEVVYLRHADYEGWCFCGKDEYDGVKNDDDKHILYTRPANVAALEDCITELKEAEQLARADAEASKARVTVLEGVLSAAVSALEQVTDGERGGYNARNGKFVSLQMSDGERADIIHSDVTTECEGALETARAALTREGGV